MTPSLPWRRPQGAIYLQITTLIAAGRCAYRERTADRARFSTSAARLWPPSPAPDQRADEDLLSAGNRAGGRARSGSTSRHELDNTRRPRIRCSAAMRTGRGCARRVRAHAAPLHPLWAYSQPQAAGRALPHTPGGDRGVLARALSAPDPSGPTPGTCAGRARRSRGQELSTPPCARGRATRVRLVGGSPGAPARRASAALSPEQTGGNDE